MKKIFFVIAIAAGIAACNSPQEVTSAPGDSSTMTTTPVDTTPTVDTTMAGDTAKRDTLR